MADAEQEDLVDVFYRPLVRPLGNLVITFAQAEASLLGLVTELEAIVQRHAACGDRSRDERPRRRRVQVIFSREWTAGRTQSGNM